MGKRSVGRKTTSYLRTLRAWFAKSTAQLFHAAVVKVMKTNLLANSTSSSSDPTIETVMTLEEERYNPQLFL